MAKKRKALHQPPQEFAKAKEMRKYWPWRERQERAIRRSERDHECIMPSHPKGQHPYLKRNELWFETYEEAKYRLSHRKAGKIFI